MKKLYIAAMYWLCYGMDVFASHTPKQKNLLPDQQYESFRGNRGNSVGKNISACDLESLDSLSVSPIPSGPSPVAGRISGQSPEVVQGLSFDQSFTPQKSMPRQRASTLNDSITEERKMSPELQNIHDAASSEFNQKIVQAVAEELQNLRQSKCAEIVIWQKLFKNLKNIKDSPDKPNVRTRTIARVCRIVAQNAFVALSKKCTMDEEKISAMFHAKIHSEKIESMIEQATELFVPASVDLSTLPAWVIKYCFEMVEKIPHNGPAISGLRDGVPGLPLIRKTHIAYGHVLNTCNEHDMQNVDTTAPILVDPVTKAMSLVWNQLPDIRDDGTPKKLDKAGKPVITSDDRGIRKTIFPVALQMSNIEQFLIALVQNIACGKMETLNYSLHLFRDPKTNLTIQACVDAGGAMISTAYPMKIIAQADWQQGATKKPLCIMRQYKSMQAVLDPKSKKFEEIILSTDEIKSYIAKSDRVIAIAEDSVIVDIGHIDPLYTLMTNLPQPVESTPKKGKQQAKIPFDCYAKAVSSAKISQYCPIGIEISFAQLEGINPTLAQKAKPKPQLALKVTT